MDSGRERARRVVRQRAWRAAARPGIVCSAAVALVVFDVAEQQPRQAMLPRRPSQIIMTTIMAICCERHWKVLKKEMSKFSSVAWEMEKENLPRDPGKI